jgi:hypothetical protein
MLDVQPAIKPAANNAPSLGIHFVSNILCLLGRLRLDEQPACQGARIWGDVYLSESLGANGLTEPIETLVVVSMFRNAVSVSERRPPERDYLDA